MKIKNVKNRYLPWKVRHLLNNIRMKKQDILDIYEAYYNNEITALPAIQLIHEYNGAIGQMITDAFVHSYITEYQRDLLSTWSIRYFDTYVNSLSFNIFNKLERSFPDAECN